jgi:hypothetical protein
MSTVITIKFDNDNKPIISILHGESEKEKNRKKKCKLKKALKLTKLVDECVNDLIITELNAEKPEPEKEITVIQNTTPIVSEKEIQVAESELDKAYPEKKLDSGTKVDKGEEEPFQITPVTGVKEYETSYGLPYNASKKDEKYIIEKKMENLLLQDDKGTQLTGNPSKPYSKIIQRFLDSNLPPSINNRTKNLANGIKVKKQLKKSI